MKYIVIGCPYTGMKNLENAFKQLTIDAEIINSNDIEMLTLSSFYTKGREIKIDEVKASFIRYPYDLIPPHSGTFKLREDIEFYKSLALAFDSVSINKLSSTWELRNRYFSLKKATTFEINVPDIYLLKNFREEQISKNVVLKAIGNCFVTEIIDEIPTEIRTAFRYEEDDGDIAVILPVQYLNNHEIKSYISHFETCFLQKKVDSINEYRCYIINESVFVYQRERIDSLDKSSAKYTHTEYLLSSKTLNGLIKMMQCFNLTYLCFDVIIDQNGIEYVIDINPYGSMPIYEELPKPSIKLAQELNKLSNNEN